MPFQVYRASAGSGKTFTLVSEYLNLCLSGTDPGAYSRVLAITFTNKAAAEMKERIIVSLQQLASNENGKIDALRNILIAKTGIESNELSKRAGQCLRHMLHNYSLIGISTIDRFTLRILKGFAHELGLPSRFDVTMDLAELQTRIVDMILEKVGMDDELTESLLDLVDAQTDNEKSWTVERILIDITKELFSEDGRQRMKQLDGVTWEHLSRIRKDLSAANRDFERKLKAIGKKGTQLIRENGIEIASFYYGKSGIGQYLFNLQTLALKELSPNSRVMTSVNHDKWYAGKCPADQKDSIDSISGELGQMIIEVLTILEKEESTYNLNSVILRNLHGLSLLSAMKLCMDEIQQQTDTVSISEFNHLINDQVMDQPAPYIYERLGNRYQHFLIDEFQDTSVLQWFNLLPLLDESLSRSGFCMVVGDGKQSIYRWRGGKVEQFNRLPNVFLEPGTEMNEHAQIMLQHRSDSLKAQFSLNKLEDNWRSLPAIINTNNRLFEFLALQSSIENADVYRDVKQNTKKNTNQGLVVFACIEGEFREAKEIKINNHLEKLSAWILECINDKVPLGDMAVLVRKNSEAQSVATMLLEMNLKVVSKEALAINGSAAVRTAVGVVSFLINPDDKINCAALLKDQHELLNPSTPLPEYLKKLSPSPKDAVVSMFRNNYGELNSEELLSLPLFQMFERIFALIAPHSNDPRISFFLDLVLDHSAKDGSDLFTFMDLWLAKREKMAIKMDARNDAIQVLTVHQSKGLQFPVVFHPFVEYNPNAHQNTIWANVSREDLNPLKVIRTNAIGKLEGTQLENDLNLEKQRDELDRLNVLYVALTRAEDRLFVSVNEKSFNGSMANRVLDFLKEEGHPINAGEEVRYGKRWVLPKPSNTQPTTECSLTLEKMDRRALPKFRAVSRQNPEAWNDLSDPRQHGKLVHSILEQLHSRDDLTGLEHDSRLSSLKTEERVKILASVKAVTEHPLLKNWYDQEVEVLNEQEILLKDGTIIRPDRMSRKGNETTVIEYKTGLKKPQHEVQLKTYLEAMQPLCAAPPKGLLVYLPKLEVLEVG